MLNSLWASAQFSGSGSGTASDPYLIFNPTQLAQMANFLNNSDVVFELKNDLNLTEFIADNYPSEGWAPIGVSATPFKGTLKGNNRTISGLSINRSSTEYVGLFGYLNGAKIENLTLKASTVKGGDHTGVFAGYASSVTLTNIHVTATGVTGGNYTGGFIGQTASCTINTLTLTVSGTGVTGSNRTGGALGIASGTCQAAHIETAVLGTSYVGGFAGSAGANFTNCSVKGNVVGTSTHVGGFAGNASTSVFTACNQYGDVCGTGRVGGICGNSQEAPTFADCKSQGKITSTGDYTGGVLGYGDFVSMTNCSHFGDIQGTNSVGGVYGGNPPQTQEDYPVYYTGSNYSGTSWTNTSRFTQGNVNTRSINKCTAIGNVNGTQKIGGLVGSHEAGRTFRFSSAGQSSSSGSLGSSGGSSLWRGNTRVYVYDSRYYSPTDYVDYTTLNIANSYYSGNVTGTDDVGGLIGNKISGEIKNCYAYANVVGETNVGGLVGKAVGAVAGDQGTFTIKSSAAINTTVNATKNYVGRIYGYKADDYVTIGALGTADGNLSLNKTSVVKSGVVQTITDNLQNGTSIGQSMLKLKATYVAKGWNFDNDWTIQETESYPYMRYQAAPPVIESNLVSQATSVSGKSINGGTVYLYYKDNAPVSQDCSGSHNWAFTTEPLQSGAEVRLYADAEGLTPSYFTTTTVAYPGSGTEDDPYLVYSAADLQGVSKQGYYKLMNDIDLTAWITENSPSKGWVSIGRNGTEATYIDGDGHKITGLWTNTTDDYTGLFSNFSRGSIKNLTVEVASGKKVKGGNYTGILIGRNANGTIQNVIVKGDVQGTQYVGGVMGSSSSNTINTVTYEGAVSSTTASARLGGIAGEASNNTVTSCRLDVTITSSGNTAYVGSAFGAATGTMTKTLANCNINATGTENRVGGLMGNGSMSINQSLTTGVVKATGSGSYAGGLVGYATGSITDCYSTATTTGTDYTAGLVAYTTSSINKCYAKGDATGVLNGAGVVAQLDGASAKVQRSVAANNQLTFTGQSSWASRVIGGYKNGAADPDNSNYALKTMQVTLNGVATKKYDDLVEGIAKEQSVLQTSAFYESLGWDMTKTWAIDEGQMYPYLLWEVDINPVVEITFDKTTAVVAAGNTLTLVPNIQPLSATNKRLAWTTSKASVATVEDGVVTAVSIGEATITATATDGSNVSATCKVTVVANHDEAIAQLRDDVDAALALYNNSTEGSNIGQYAAGSRAALLKVINEVRALISDTMDETAISNCSSKLAKAVADFKAQKVTGGADTDITLLDNVVYIEPVQTGTGRQLTLSVKMKNTKAFTGYKFDLYLPDGCTFATDEDGFPLAALSLERTTTAKTNYFDSSILGDGDFLRVLCYSSKGYAFTGEDGEIATVTIDIPADMEAGDYALVLKDIELAVGDESYDTGYVKSTLTVTTYKLGDANDDGKIGVADLTAIASHILGTTPIHFVQAAADANEDGKIGVADLTCIAGWILNGTANSQRRAQQQINAEGLSISLDNFNIIPGETALVAVNIANPGAAFAGYQFDIVLPEGLRVVDAAMSTQRHDERSMMFEAAQMDDNTYRVLCYSTRNTVFEGNDGAVALLTIAADNNLPSGYYNAEIADAAVSLYGTSITPACKSAVVAVDMVTGIHDIMQGDNANKIYDLNGRSVNGAKLSKGVYIVNGQKIVK